MKKESGFSIAELCVVLAIVGILLGIASPLFTRALQASQETAAVQGLRQVSDAEGVYFQMFGTYSPDLPSLGGGGCTATQAPTATASCILDSSIAVTPYTKNGYFYSADGTLQTMVTDGAGNNWTVYFGFEGNSSPTQELNAGGFGRNYCVDQTGVLMFQDGNSPIGTSQGSCSQVTTTSTSGPVR